jgi:hypothetical protein
VPQTLPNPHTPFPIAPPTTTLFDAPSVVRYWHLTSLDAPTVAVVWTLAFSSAVEIHLPVWVPVLLGLAAWTAYILDRLLDARAAVRAGILDDMPERHRFHHLHRRTFTALAIVAAVAAAGIVWILMPVAARERNSALALAALAYFTRVHIRLGDASPAPAPQKRLPIKELLVGLIFTAACVLPAASRMPQKPIAIEIAMAAVALAFALLAWLNCYSIDSWEGPTLRRKDDLPLPAILLCVGLLVAAATLAWIDLHFTALLLAAAVSAGLLALLDCFRERFTPIALRAAADLVLLTPLALLLQ